ncbi:uncharacterized protein JCM6883_002761 [Sporobolomyces salmoneus]|uniref:uncharacterized protein n=1 Tax=Sporobolomyces salmoneus TaxID=183962 RepID=UPI00316ED631
MSSPFPSSLLSLSVLLLVSRSTSFTHASSQSLSTLSHLLQQYLATLAETSLSHANHSGRDQVSVWDLGRAIEEFGVGGIRGLEDELLKGDEGIEEEVGGVRELAKNLQDHLALDVPQPPLAQISYDPLNQRDLDLLNALQHHSFVDLDDLDDEENEEEEEEENVSSPSTSATSLEATQEEEEEESVTIKPDPDSITQKSVNDLFGDLDQVLAGENSNEFLDSLGLGSSTTSNNATNEVGDLTVSMFHPFDTAGRPIDSISLIQPESFNLDEAAQEREYRPFSAWRDDSERPEYVPDWFPPFPGSEKESDQSIQARRRREEKERERRAKEGATGAVVGKSRVSTALGGQGDPWSDAVPFSSSILAESFSIQPNTLPTPSSPHRQSAKLNSTSTGGENEAGRANKKRRTNRRRSLSPPAVQPSSLPSFNTIAPLLPHAPTYLRPSQLRRSAASLISHDPHHPELQISSDSLFGVLPYVPTMRQPTLPPGFLPDFAPPLIHAFNTNLPWTVSSPVPYHPSTSVSVLSASSPHPRVPSSLSQIAKNLSFPLQFDPKNPDQLHPNLGLFSRLKRIGPPGPLGGKGETLNYDYVGQTALISMNVEWSQRDHAQKLPKKFGSSGDDAGTPGGGGEGGGIKLKLGGSVNRAGGGANGESRIGSPVNGFGNGSGQTPGPSGLRRSESVVPHFETSMSSNTGGGGHQQQQQSTTMMEFEEPDMNEFFQNLDSFPTTESRRNSLSISQQPSFEGTTINGHHHYQDQDQGMMLDGGGGGGMSSHQQDFPEWLLQGQPPPNEDHVQQETIETNPTEHEQGGGEGAMAIDPALESSTNGGETNSSEQTSSSALPSLPTLPIMPTSSRPLPPPPPPPAPAPAPAPVPSSSSTPSNPPPPPVSMNMFDPSNFPPPS